jgi:hypothetical protein
MSKAKTAERKGNHGDPKTSGHRITLKLYKLFSETALLAPYRSRSMRGFYEKSFLARLPMMNMIEKPIRDYSLSSLSGSLLWDEFANRGRDPGD